MKKLICLSFTIILIITCSSCIISNETNTIKINRISSPEKSFPFSKPDFKDVEFQSGQYNYKNVTQQELEDYINVLVSEGFHLYKEEYEYYLQKNNIFLRITNNTKSYQSLHLEYIEGMPQTIKGALNCNLAKNIIGNDDIDIMEIYVPNLYEYMGAKLFYTVSKNNGKNFWPNKYIITKNQSFPISTVYNEFNVCDIDKDGSYELLYLFQGPTSGIFSFGIGALSINNNVVTTKFNNVFLPVKWDDLMFNQLSNSETSIYSAEYINELRMPKAKLYSISVSNENLVLKDTENKLINGSFRP